MSYFWQKYFVNVVKCYLFPSLRRGRLKEATLLNCFLTLPTPERRHAAKQSHITLSSLTIKKEFITTEIKRSTSERTQQQHKLHFSEEILLGYVGVTLLPR